MIINGLTITAVGMTIVFVFLILLVVTMNLLFYIIKKFFPNALKGADKAAAESSPPAKEVSKEENLGEIAAVVAAARSYIAANRG